MLFFLFFFSLSPFLKLSFSPPTPPPSSPFPLTGRRVAGPINYGVPKDGELKMLAHLSGTCHCHRIKRSRVHSLASPFISHTNPSRQAARQLALKPRPWICTLAAYAIKTVVLCNIGDRWNMQNRKQRFIYIICLSLGSHFHDWKK